MKKRRVAKDCDREWVMIVLRAVVGRIRLTGVVV